MSYGMQGILVAVGIELGLAGIIALLINWWANSGDTTAKWQRKLDWTLWWENDGPLAIFATCVVMIVLIPGIGFLVGLWVGFCKTA